MRQLAALAGLAMLSACTGQGLPQWITGLPDEGPSFGVATPNQVPTQPGYAGFTKVSADLLATHADQICTLGWQNLGEETVPGEQVPLTETTVRCNTYRPTL